MGDGDSSEIPMTVKKYNQNNSDLAFVLSRYKGRKAPEVALLVGFLGGRIDHQLFNLGEIALYLKQFTKNNAPVIQLDDKIVFVGTGTHSADFKGIFSLASFEANQIKVLGKCKYKRTEQYCFWKNCY
jgi:thiamine pyrophosphokinase